jgi:hypothetical protein
MQEQEHTFELPVSRFGCFPGSFILHRFDERHPATRCLEDVAVTLRRFGWLPYVEFQTMRDAPVVLFTISYRSNRAVLSPAIVRDHALEIQHEDVFGWGRCVDVFWNRQGFDSWLLHHSPGEWDRTTLREISSGLGASLVIQEAQPFKLVTAEGLELLQAYAAWEWSLADSEISRRMPTVLEVLQHHDAGLHDRFLLVHKHRREAERACITYERAFV